jgi:hypothetical protein
MRPRLAALALAALAACGKATTDPEPTLTFVPVVGMACADGSTTGLGVSRGSEEVLLYLAPGGACWSATQCDASPGPFRAADLALAEQAVLRGSILDRQLAGNPFARWTLVVIPYCTGDVHAGDKVQTYGGQTWRHRGRPNVDAAVDWIDANLPRPTRIVVAGSSAGGFGALLAYDVVRARWPSGEAPLVSAGLLDDSGPTFEPSTASTPGLDPALTNAWWDAWNLASTVTPLCPGCKSDLSQIWTVLSGKYPQDLMALLSSTNDPTIEGFFGLLPLDFSPALASLTTKLDALPAQNVAVFRTATSGHALLLSPASYSASGRSLLSWLDPIAVGTGAFASAGP